MDAAERGAIASMPHDDAPTTTAGTTELFGKIDGETVRFLVQSSFAGDQLDELKRQIAMLRRLRAGDRFVLPGQGTPRATKERVFGLLDLGCGAELRLSDATKTYFTHAEWMYSYRELPLFSQLSDERSTDAAKAKFARKRDGDGRAELNLADVNRLATKPVEILEREGKRLLEHAHLREIERLREEADALNEMDDDGQRLALENRIKQLELVRVQQRVRNELVFAQQEIMQMPERAYKKMVKDNIKILAEKKKKAEKKEKQEQTAFYRSVLAMRKRINEESNNARDERLARNKAVLKMHEKLNREFMRKARDENSERLLRLEALKANDLAAYRELLAEARGRETDMTAEGEGDKYEALTSFLNATESYLTKLGGKIAAVKIEQARSEAAAAAASEAEAKGLTEEEVKVVAEEAANSAAIDHGEAILDGAADGGDTKERYYAMAHSTQEIITHQPRMLTFGKLRDYQLVSLQWMISLYNNKLNGILADEMGLGKTVQVCALIAYLFESKQNFGPHLIIVPNAVIVNWKAEIRRWLPKLSTVFYVGSKDARAKIFQRQVLQLKFNVLVTSYEFIMRDRSKLSKVAWKYIIIDEAHRLKDREGRLSRDLDKFRAQRRLLLTGTPLQNELSELWSLLNLLLPEVFDSSKVFQEWFGGNSKVSNDADGEDWIEREKKVIVISRLHQILEPFMLRRLVQDVESKLPPRVTVIVHCPFSAFQSACYDWIRKTASIRVEPGTRIGLAAQQNFRGYLPLQNRAMELRKLCNHPSLSYPPEKGGDFRGPNLVRAGGKLWILDRLLVKLQRSGHRVLLFCTMTKLLDLLENYLQWRWTTPDGQDLKYCRIDGNTSLEQREIAINDFNAPHSDKFIFLLSIRAAGRGLNLQTADTVVVYDPDPNPKNEEQAIARAHRIGQTREVRVIHFEAVDDDIVQKKKGSKKEEVGWGGPNRSYCESLESSVRNVIQKQKIEMAAEIVDAGRFDGQTTHAERRETLENLLQQQANGTRTGVSVPPLKELNGKIARSQEEWDLFNRLDEELDWPGALLSSAECPSWIKYTQDEIDQAVFANSKVGQSSVTQFNENMGRGARSTNNLNASGSAVWTHADRQEGDFIDRTGIADDDGDEDEESDDVAVREDSIEDIGDIDIDDIEDAQDDDDTTTLNTVEMNDADEDDGGESPKRRRLEY